MSHILSQETSLIYKSNKIKNHSNKKNLLSIKANHAIVTFQVFSSIFFDN